MSGKEVITAAIHLRNAREFTRRRITKQKGVEGERELCFMSPSWTALWAGVLIGRFRQGGACSPSFCFAFFAFLCDFSLVFFLWDYFLVFFRGFFSLLFFLVIFKYFFLIVFHLFQGLFFRFFRDFSRFYPVIFCAFLFFIYLGNVYKGCL